LDHPPADVLEKLGCGPAKELFVGHRQIFGQRETACAEYGTESLERRLKAAGLNQQDHCSSLVL
jgi:hypothetical protein